MRTMIVELKSGEELELVASFKAANAFAQKIGDPLQILEEVIARAMSTQDGSSGVYTGWRFTLDNIVEMLYLGNKYSERPVKDRTVIEEAVMDAGIINAQILANRYLEFLISPDNFGQPKDEDDEQPSLDFEGN